MKKGKKIFLAVLFSILGLVIVTLSTVIIFHFSYKVEGVSAKIENTTGIVQASGRGLYDENGDEIIFKGVNLGGWFVTEGWLEPYVISDPVYEERDGESRPVYYTTNFKGDTLEDKLSQDEMLRALKNNPNNFSNADIEEILNVFYENWITEEDFRNIKEMGFNEVRIPFGWRMILNDDYTVRTDLDESLKHLDNALKWAKNNGIYVCLDLHTCPLSQNGYEHGGSIEWLDSTPGKDYAKLWESEDAINATIKIWETISNRYNNKEYSSTICMYDIMNEPRNTTGSTDKVCWDVFDKIYKKIRSLNDKHVISFEGCWVYLCLPNPKKYGWENVCYQYHWYNFSPFNKNNFEFELYYAYQDAFMMLADYDVPIYMGEFSLFEGKDEADTFERWDKGLTMFEDRHYSWSLWTYKKVVNGWWGDSWGIYNLNMSEENGSPYKVRVNLSKATKAEIIAAFDSSKISTSNCKKSVMYNVIKEHNTK